MLTNALASTLPVTKAHCIGAQAVSAALSALGAVDSDGLCDSIDLR